MNNTRAEALIIEMVLSLLSEDYESIKNWTVEEWVLYGDIPKQFKNLPNAVKALEILSSPLYKALKEEKV